MKLLITGAAGFIGSNLVHLLRRERSEWSIRVLDSLTYAGHAGNLEPHLGDQSVELIVGDVANTADVNRAVEGVDTILHLAAESHVDRSILGSAAFVQTNVVGTHRLLEAARKGGLPMIIISTDEVYGDLGPKDPAFTEQHPIKPSSPYSASKAAADHFGLSFVRTYDQDVRITRCCNNYGPRQFPEKLIPFMIGQILQGAPCPMYGDGQQVRDWIHVDDHNRAVLAVLEKGEAGEVYNIGAREELTNLEVVEQLGLALERTVEIEFVADRPGHDRRYAVNPAKIERDLHWQPTVDWKTGLSSTVQWYLDNSEWIESIKSGAYKSYLKSNYGHR